MIAETISLVAAALEIVAAAISLGESPDPDDRKKAADIQKALWSIYFSPHQTLGVIKGVALGKPFDRAEAQAALDEFDHRERDVLHALDRFDFRQLQKHQTLTPGASEELHRIGRNKWLLRQEVRSFMRKVIAADGQVDRSDARALQSALVDLNGQIEQLSKICSEKTT